MSVEEDDKLFLVVLALPVDVAGVAGVRGDCGGEDGIVRVATVDVDQIEFERGLVPPRASALELLLELPDTPPS